MGPSIEIFQRAADIPPGSPWCAAFVNFCAEMASALKNEWSPLEQVKREGYVQDYYDWAKNKGKLIKAEDIGPGDLFVIWFPKKERYAHIGFVDVVDLEGMLFTTIEGNTNESGGREGFMVAARPRHITDMVRFIRWA